MKYISKSLSTPSVDQRRLCFSFHSRQCDVDVSDKRPRKSPDWSHIDPNADERLHSNVVHSSWTCTIFLNWRRISHGSLGLFLKNGDLHNWQYQALLSWQENSFLMFFPWWIAKLDGNLLWRSSRFINWKLIALLGTQSITNPFRGVH
jgi:hypothetical protein